MKNVVLKSLLLGTALTVASSNFAFAEGWTGFRIGAGGGGNYGFTDMEAAGFGLHEDGVEGINFAVAGTGTPELGELTTEELDSQAAYSFLMGIYSSLMQEQGDVSGVIDNFGTPSEVGAAGAFGTVDLGYDVQIAPSVVMGLSADYSLGKTKLQMDNYGIVLGTDESDAYGASLSTLSTDLELGNTWSVGGRLGFTPTEKTLLFVSAGYTQVKANLSTQFNAGAIVGIDSGSQTETGTIWDMDASDTAWLNGYYVGGGMETMLAESLSLKLEYRFADLENMSVQNDDFDEIMPADVDDQFTAVGASVDPNIHSIRATIGIRF